MDRFGGGRRPSGQRCNVGAAWIRSNEPLDVTSAVTNEPKNERAPRGKPQFLLPPPADSLATKAVPRAFRIRGLARPLLYYEPGGTSMSHATSVVDAVAGAEPRPVADPVPEPGPHRARDAPWAQERHVLHLARAALGARRWRWRSCRCSTTTRLPGHETLKAFFVQPLEVAPPPPPPPPPRPRARARDRRRRSRCSSPAASSPPSTSRTRSSPRRRSTSGSRAVSPAASRAASPAASSAVSWAGCPTEAPPPPARGRPDRRPDQGAEQDPQRRTRSSPTSRSSPASRRLVILEAEVDTRGHVKTIRSSAATRSSTRRRRQAVKQWRYQPLLLNGEPTGFILTVTSTSTCSSLQLTASHPGGPSAPPSGGPLGLCGPRSRDDRHHGVWPILEGRKETRWTWTSAANPALLKLDLYCKGMRIDDSCLVEQDGGRKILRTRAGLGSGLEVVLPGGLWTNVPVTETFAAAARPTCSTARNGAYVAASAATRRSPTLELSPRPAWYDRKTTTGKTMTRVGTLQGTYLGRLPGEGLRVLDREAAEVELQVLLGGPEPRRGRRRRQVGERGDGGDPRRARGVRPHLRGLQHRPLRRATPISTSSSRTSGGSSSETGILVGVQTPPHPDLKRYDALRELGVNRVSFCFEIFDPLRLQGGLPRQGPPVRPAALPRRRRVLREARQEGPAPRAVGHERRDHRRPRAARVLDQGDRLDHVGGRHPDRLRLPPARGHRLRRHAAAADRAAGPGLPPPLRGLHGAAGCRSAWPRTSTSASCCCPTSAARLSERRFPLQTLKLKVMGQAAKMMVYRNIRTAEARARAGAAA